MPMTTIAEDRGIFFLMTCTPTCEIVAVTAPVSLILAMWISLYRSKSRTMLLSPDEHLVPTSIALEERDEPSLNPGNVCAGTLFGACVLTGVYIGSLRTAPRACGCASSKSLALLGARTKFWPVGSVLRGKTRVSRRLSLIKLI